MTAVTLHWWPIIVAVIVNIIVGGAYYSSKVFGPRWQKLVGIKTDTAQSMRGPAMVQMIVFQVIMVTALAMVIGLAQATTFWDGVWTGLWVWFGFVVTTKGTEYAFSQKPRDLLMLVLGHHLLEFVIAGAILAMWQ